MEPSVMLPPGMLCPSSNSLHISDTPFLVALVTYHPRTYLLFPAGVGEELVPHPIDICEGMWLYLLSRWQYWPEGRNLVSNSVPTQASCVTLGKHHHLGGVSVP